MNKLPAYVMTICAAIIKTNSFADGIQLFDQTHSLYDVNSVVNAQLEAYIGYSGDRGSVTFYADGFKATIETGLTAYKRECNYTVYLRRDHSIEVKVTFESDAAANERSCTKGIIRPAAPVYSPGKQYMQNDIVRFEDSKENTIGIYKCVYSKACSSARFQPGQKNNSNVWVQLSKSYKEKKQNTTSSGNEDIIVEFTDYKHAPFSDIRKDNLIIKGTLKPKKSPLNDISFYVDGTLVTLPQDYHTSGNPCQYEVTLSRNNAIYVHSHSKLCSGGTFRKAAHFYSTKADYKKGDIAIVRHAGTDEYRYYHCTDDNLCDLEFYKPEGKHSSFAWIMTAFNIFPDNSEITQDPASTPQQEDNNHQEL